MTKAKGKKIAPKDNEANQGNANKGVFDVSCGIHASKSWVMGAPIR
jgi:hypothetical protein